ncbi:YitT family protein [Caproiciproducens sp. CPB-2]|uniref:YitT family protein n=1 Tax=unclassified Caproiciproducens TaxID=2643836 RepID=UPI0023DB9A86|nr:YitT family protein [Caproiciproducens sp. CPB-2]MDF1496222.1 YitT family protein [Caproiciproducens sp. CPB-2]
MLSETPKEKAIGLLKDILFFVVGSLIYAVSVNVFTAPNQIAPGGVTGASTMINYLFSWPIGMTGLLLNIPIFIWAIMEIGYKLVGKTIVATVFVSVSIDLVGKIVPAYTGEKMLAAIFGGIIEGIGLSLVFMRGGTTGGTDLVARLLGRRLRNLSMGKLMLCVDMMVVVASAFVYGNIESALYATITIFVSTRLIDALLYGTDTGTGKLLFIMSVKNDEIAQDILTDMDRGVTVLKSRGAYSGREGEVLLCAVRRYEVVKVKDIVRSHDHDAFMIIGDAGEISGEGFRQVKAEDKTLKELIAHVNAKKNEK